MLIDVRQPEEYEAGHVPTARLLPLQELPDRVAELPTDARGLRHLPHGEPQLRWPASS